MDSSICLELFGVDIFIGRVIPVAAKCKLLKGKFSCDEPPYKAESSVSTTCSALFGQIQIWSHIAALISLACLFSFVFLTGSILGLDVLTSNDSGSLYVTLRFQ